MGPPNGNLSHDPIFLCDLTIHREREGRIALMSTLNVGFRALETARVPHIVEDFDIVRSNELRETPNISASHHFLVEPSN